MKNICKNVYLGTRNLFIFRTFRNSFDISYITVNENTHIDYYSKNNHFNNYRVLGGGIYVEIVK